MQIDEPTNEGYTIYSKSGCINCTKVKKMLKEKNLFFMEVQCDDFLIEDKAVFLLFIHEKAKKEYNTFPMVFYKGDFIGGYKETKENIEKLEVLFED
jgi:glutaredoxin